MQKSQSVVKFFNKDAKKWSSRSDFRNNSKFDTIKERNIYVENYCKSVKPKFHLDIGCGTGDLIYRTSFITSKSVGIDFSEKMIDIALRKNSRLNAEFKKTSIFDYESDLKFDLISANGFIEYLSILEIKKFFDICNKILSPKGVLIFSVRNRLFNIFSSNKFTSLEIKSKKINTLIRENIDLATRGLRSLKNKNFLNFGKAKYPIPVQRIKVKERHQFTPHQINQIIKSYNFKLIDIHPVNFHCYPVNLKMNENFRKKIFDQINKIDLNSKLSLLGQSSTFMTRIKKK